MACVVSAQSHGWRARWRDNRLSVRQYVKAVKECPGDELDARLRDAVKEFPGSTWLMLRELLQSHRASFSEAYNRLAMLKFEVGPHLLMLEVFHCYLTKLTPACFELALTMWPKLDTKTKDWLSVRLVEYWRSPAGANLSSSWLHQSKQMWQQVSPTQNQKLAPARACDLAWSQEETELFLSTHVDLTGDTSDLVRELLDRKMLSGSIMLNQGIIGGLLSVDPRLAADKLLSGELSLTKLQASFALRLGTTLAEWDQEFTTQNVRHLYRFIETLCTELPNATNAMYQLIDPLMMLITKLKPEDRPNFCLLISGLYIDTFQNSRVAEIPHRDQATSQHTCLHIHSYKVFLERAIGCLSLDEITSSVRNCNPFLDDYLSNKFYHWALAQLDQPQTAQKLFQFIKNWLVQLCTPDQVLAFWLKAIDCVNSWSFLLNSVSIAAEGCKKDIRMCTKVIELLESEPHVSLQHRDTVLLVLKYYWPCLIAERYGITKWLELNKCSYPSVHLVARETYKLSEGATQVNDCFLSEKELRRLISEHPKLHKTKTKEDFALLSDWVRNLDTNIFCNLELAEQIGQMLCEKWSDKVMLLSLCERFTMKSLECLEVTRDCSALTKFVAKCPNLGNKQDFLVKQLGSYFAQRPGKAELSVLHPLFAAHITRVSHLVDILHALKCRQVKGDVQQLFLDLLLKEDTPEKRTQLLKTCQFSTPPQGEPLDECVDCIGEEAWSDVEAWAQSSSKTEAAVAAAEQPGGGITNALTHPDLPLYALYQHFGPGGEMIIREYFQSAKPSQVADLFAGSPSFRALCRVAIGSWHLEDCPADQVQPLLDVIAWFPELYSRCAPLVWGAGEESQVRQLLSLSWSSGKEKIRHALDLNALPRNWWHCLHWPSTNEADLARAAEAGIMVPLEEVGFAARSPEAQVLLLDLHGNDLDTLAGFCPQVAVPIQPYLERVFELLPLSDKMLAELGDGVEDEERLASGWNKIVHRLLVGIRERIKDGNMLHTDEQLLLYGGCAVRHCDNTNSSLLADFMESKMVDPQHSAPLVTYVLNTHNFKNIVRDSALRAMMRLPKDDRDALHHKLLERASSKLPLQVIFSLVVTQLAEGVFPLVLDQLQKLSVEEWSELLSLIKDANPAGGKSPHTFPRSLSPEFNERFLLRYLIDEVSKRDPRFFLLFVKCTPPAAVPQYVLSVLVAQRHALDDLLLESLTVLTLDEFREVIEFIQPAQWSTRLDWVLTRIKEAPNACEMMRVVLDVFAHKEFEGQYFMTLLADILTAPQAKDLLQIEEVRLLIRERLPRLELGKEERSVRRGNRSDTERSLWILFFRECWLAGVHCTSEELTSTLQLDKRKMLDQTEVQKLGVDLAAHKMLIQLVPSLAIPTFGYKVLEQEALFAKTLTDMQLLEIKELSAKNDAHWGTCRKVIAEVEPATALQLAIKLFKHSREERDLELISIAYQSVDGFTRKQTWLPTELGDLWSKFGDQIQRNTIDPVLLPQHTISLEVSRMMNLKRVPSTASWEVVEEDSQLRPLI